MLLSCVYFVRLVTQRPYNNWVCALFDTKDKCITNRPLPPPPYTRRTARTKNGHPIRDPKPSPYASAIWNPPFSANMSGSFGAAHMRPPHRTTHSDPQKFITRHFQQSPPLHGSYAPPSGHLRPFSTWQAGDPSPPVWIRHRRRLGACRLFGRQGDRRPARAPPVPR